MSSLSQNFIFFVVVVLVAAAVWIYYNRDQLELKCILSTVNGKRYCVRDTRRAQESADMLARITVKMTKLVDYLKETDAENPAVKRLAANFNPDKITETLPNSELTAYSENKSKMAFCLTEKKEESTMIDENTLMFVAIHEMGHLATKSVGHKSEFWANFEWLLNKAVKIGIYSPQNYAEEPVEFCGMRVTDNPLYDKK